MSEIMVSVQIMAYNQKEYIKDAIEGALMQRTTFPIEIIIHDDASTDGTADIIREYANEYPNVIIPILQKENQFSRGIDIGTEFFSKVRKGKYIATCEGDDYWTDRDKLQKQIDFLEENPDYSLCIHNAWKLDQNTQKRMLLNTFSKSGSYPLEYQVKVGLGTNYPAYASYVFRNIPIDAELHQLRAGIVGDYQLRLVLAKRGNVYYFEEPMSVYRYAAKSSFTESLNTNLSFFINYISQITNAYHRMNKYLDYKFDDIYRCKIKSDYLGLAARVTSARAFDKVKKLVDDNFDWEQYETYVDLLDENKLSESLETFVKEAKELYLYGTSPLAKAIEAKLCNHGYKVEGFVVSDGFSKVDSFCNKKTVYLSEMASRGVDVSVVLSVQPINEIDIARNIEKYSNIRTYSIS